jgi:TolA-binding protein
VQVQQQDKEMRTLVDRVAGLSDRVDAVGESAERAEAASTVLARALEDLVDRHRKVDRTLNLNSFVAYALFTFLLGGGFFALYKSRVGELVGERDEAIASRDAAQIRAETATATLARRDAASKSALEVFQLHRDHRFAEAVAAQAKLSVDDLSPSEKEFFAEAIGKAKAGLAEAALEAGKTAVRANDFALAAERFAEGLTHVDQGPIAMQLRYQRGAAFGRLGQVVEAEKELTSVLAAGAEAQGVPEARFALAELYERQRRWEDARREYRAFGQKAPNHALARAARNRLVWLYTIPTSTKSAKPAAAAPTAAAPAPVTRPATRAALPTR